MLEVGVRLLLFLYCCIHIGLEDLGFGACDGLSYAIVAPDPRQL